MDELEEIKRKKLESYLAMQQQAENEALAKAQQEAMIEAQIKSLMQKILDPKARERLANIRLAKPELARQVELLIIQLYQAGRIRDKLTDEQLKSLLTTLTAGKREWKIKRV